MKANAGKIGAGATIGSLLIYGITISYFYFQPKVYPVEFSLSLPPYKDISYGAIEANEKWLRLEYKLDSIPKNMTVEGRYPKVKISEHTDLKYKSGLNEFHLKPDIRAAGCNITKAGNQIQIRVLKDVTVINAPANATIDGCCVFQGPGYRKGPVCVNGVTVRVSTGAQVLVAGTKTPTEALTAIRTSATGRLPNVRTIDPSASIKSFLPTSSK